MIDNVHNCYGCGVCGIACPQGIIRIMLNTDGFYEPQITDRSRCTNCNLCMKVCAYCHDNLVLQNKCIKSYAAWSNNIQIRHNCSSGGISFEIGKLLINRGYKVCGVRYNIDMNRAEHYIASNIEDLMPSIGSKYIQSYTVDGFKTINRKDKYLVTGTPCQIDSFRRYIKQFRCEENFVLMDFFCHGVPSMLLWQKYLEEVEKNIGKITDVSWRNKFTGWHDSWSMSIKGEKGVYNSRLSQGDAFYRLFLGDACLSNACYQKCKFKYDKSSADIRIGDLWGKTYRHDEKGVSAAIAFTEKGNEVLKLCDCTLVEHPFEVVAEGQMKNSPPKRKYVAQLIKVLKRKDACLHDAVKKMKVIELRKKIHNRIKRSIQILKNIIRLFL